MGYRHVVLFRFHDTATGEQLARAERLLRALGELPGVLEWRVERSIDTRKGVVVAELGLFRDRAAFEAWRASDEHRAVAAELALCSDWVVADFPD